MYKSKIFSGMDADQQFNHWCEKHTNISIMAFRFISAENTRSRYFVICIMYMELDPNRTISYAPYPVLDEES